MQHLFLQVGYSPKLAKEEAELIVAEIEGSVMLMRLLKDPSFLTRTLNKLKIHFTQNVNV
jgi:hypothetical protein